MLPVENIPLSRMIHQERIQPALASVDQGAGRDYPNQVNRLRDAIRQRGKSIEQQLKSVK